MSTVESNNLPSFQDASSAAPSAAYINCNIGASPGHVSSSTVTTAPVSTQEPGHPGPSPGYLNIIQIPNNNNNSNSSNNNGDLRHEYENIGPDTAANIHSPNYVPPR